MTPHASPFASRRLTVRPRACRSAAPLAALALALAATSAPADVVASSADSKLDVKTGTSNFLIRSSTGHIGIHVWPDGDHDPAVDRPNAVGRFWIGGIESHIGRNVSAAKDTPDSSDSFTNSVQKNGHTATATGIWSYVYGDVVDAASYRSSARVTPDPDSRDHAAFANSRDPIEVDVDYDVTPAEMEFSPSLSETLLEAGEFLGAGVRVAAQYRLDEQNICQLDINVPGGFLSAGEIDVQLSSMFGGAFDAAVAASIRDAMVIDPSTHTVTLLGPIDLVPSFMLPLTECTHVLDGALVAGVVPEPESVVLLVVGGAPLRWRRG